MKLPRGMLEIAIGLAVLATGLVVAVLDGSSDQVGAVKVSWVRAGAVVVAAIGFGVVAFGYLRAVRAMPQKISLEARHRAIVLIAAGLASLAIGIAATPLLKGAAGIELAVIYAPMVIGLLVFAWGLVQLAPREGTGGPALEHVPGIGYRSFVAWRYLLDRRHVINQRTKVGLLLLIAIRVGLWPAFGVGMRVDATAPLHQLGIVLLVMAVLVLCAGILRYSKLSLGVFIFGMFVVVLAVAALFVVPMLGYREELEKVIIQIAKFTIMGAAGLAGLAAFFGTLRGTFTFFTTVPIGGVWIGTAALVLVLAVMSGFETDLRDKILGSNAHIQVSKEEGDFVDWQEVKKKIDKIPGVVASTPFATSEVVIAAHNNGANVIIKGIDVATVREVTNLVDTLIDPVTEHPDPRAINELDPKREGQPDRTVPQAPRDTPSDLDPPPDDMPLGGDPIDFSGGEVPDAGADDAKKPDPKKPDAKPAAGNAKPGPAGDPDTESLPYGGDANRIVDLAGGADMAFDSDLLRWATGEHDYDPSVRVITVRDSDPIMLVRTRALPGILVGKELAKQMSLYIGQEVRVVSPLSDPSNPDATGTPIPFNRDYRVAGVFYTGMYEYDLKFVYVTLESLQDFLDLGDTVDGIEIRLDSADATPLYVPSETSPGLIREMLGPGYRVQDWRELNRSLFSALKLEKIAMFLVLGIVILVASFSIIGNLIMVVVEKAREIALLKTLGASDTGVMTLFAIQGMIIGLIGTLLGIATGLAGAAVLDEFGLPLDPDVYYINRLPIDIDPQAVLLAAITGVIISIGATFYPAFLAARVRPAAGMRH
jgi:lipoprotein-releasing system permease protein